MSTVVARGERPLRIALVYDDSVDRHAGVPQYVTSLARGLGEKGHRVSLLVGQSRASDLAGARVHSLARNVGVRFNGNSLSMPLLSRGSEIDRVMKGGRFDVVHVQVPYSPLMAGRVIGRARSEAAVVGTFHVASERWLPRLGSRVLAAATPLSLRRFDAMMSVSRWAARFARETYGVDSRVVPNMVDAARLRAMAGRRVSADGVTRIVYLGALVERKGPDLLLEAFLRLRQDHPGLTLTIAGEGPLRRRLERKARAGGAGSAIHVVGEVSERAKAELLGGAEIACFPSRYGESFGIVLLEAIAAGSEAVVAGDNPGYAELFSSCPEAVCDPAPESLRRRLERLLDPEERRKVGVRQQALPADHRLEDITDRVLDVYEEALEARAATARATTPRAFPRPAAAADARA